MPTLKSPQNQQPSKTQNSEHTIQPISTLPLIDQLLQVVLFITVGLTPLLFSQRFTELFESPKMMLIYVLALLATILIIAKWFIQKRLTFVNSPLTSPIFLFMLWLILTTIFSLNGYTSLVGYYSRFNGGLASYVAYIILAYATLDQIISEQIRQGISKVKEPAHSSREIPFSIKNIFALPRLILKSIRSINIQNSALKTQNSPFCSQLLWTWLIAASITSVWAIFEHFGHDPSCIILRGTFTANCWVEDVQTRVFSTFGQPNWLATYLVASLPIGLYFVLTGRSKQVKVMASLASLCCYTAFWYTYSRSGWFGLITALCALAVCLPWQHIWQQRRWLIGIAIGCLIISTTSFNAAALRAESSLSGHGSDTSTGSIRLLVWQGSLSLIQHHPLLGTGLGTFAYSFLPYRPVAMNNTTEWNFLYNEAHNQVLNTAAAIGIPGLLIWLSLFAIPLLYVWKITTDSSIHRLALIVSTKIRADNQPPDTKHQTLSTDTHLPVVLTAGLVGAFVSQLFGFDVVMTNLLLFIAITVIIAPLATIKVTNLNHLHRYGMLVIAVLIIVPTGYFLFNYISAELLIKQADNQTAINNTASIVTYQTAIQRNPWEPNYRLNLTAAYINAANSTNQAINYQQADQQLKIARQLNPQNLIIIKSISYYYRSMASIDPNYQTSALQLSQEAFKLAPSDAEACQNLANLQLSLHHPNQALELYNQLVTLRPQTDSYLARATYFEQYGPAANFQKDLQSALSLDPHNAQARQMQLESRQ
jgi:putative inorganic carbon (HCO3(-)) transporter